MLEIAWLKTKHKIDFRKANCEHGNFNECDKFIYKLKCWIFNM